MDQPTQELQLGRGREPRLPLGRRVLALGRGHGDPCSISCAVRPTTARPLIASELASAKVYSVQMGGGRPEREARAGPCECDPWYGHGHVWPQPDERPYPSRNRSVQAAA